MNEELHDKLCPSRVKTLISHIECSWCQIIRAAREDERAS